MKKLLAALAVLALISIASSAMASSGHQCVQLTYKWNDISDYGITYAKLYDDGYSTLLAAAMGTGEIRNRHQLQFMNTVHGCMPLYSGSKKQGFYECTDGTSPISGPNYYIIKKSKNCASVDAIADEPAEADGPKRFSPE